MVMMTTTTTTIMIVLENMKGKVPTNFHPNFPTTKTPVLQNL